MMRSESVFSRRFCDHLKRRHPYMMVQRIESGLTGKGIPDLYLKLFGEVWVELKVDNLFCVNSPTYSVDWRPGQQAWARKYYQASCKEQCVYTVMAVNDGYVWIPMNKTYKDNRVSRTQCFVSQHLEHILIQLDAKLFM